MLTRKQIDTLITGFIEAEIKNINMSSFKALQFVKPEINLWEVSNNFIIEWCRIFGYAMLYNPNSQKDVHIFPYMENLGRLIPDQSNNHYKDIGRYIKANKTPEKIDEIVRLCPDYFSQKTFAPWVKNGRFNPQPIGGLTKIQHINNFIATIEKQTVKMRTVRVNDKTLTILCDYNGRLTLKAVGAGLSYDILNDLKLFYKMSISNIDRYQGNFNHRNKTIAERQYVDFFIGDIPENFEE